MWDYLSVVTPDNDVIFDVSPNKVIVEDGNKNVTIHTGDDGSEERIALSNTSIFYVTLIWTNRNASDAGTIMDYYHDASKGNGMAESFRWLHGSPADTHIYTVRFAGKLSRQLIAGPTVIYSFPSVRLRILGAGDKVIGAADNSSTPEVTVPAMTMTWAFSTRMADVSSDTEITAPSLNVVRLIDASDISSSTEVTEGDIGWENIDAADVSGSTEITAPTVEKVVVP